jgi:tryptophan 2,3-dioxygenase
VRLRLAAYFGWADAVQRWRAAPGDAALARPVDAGLPARLARREVSAAEARQLKAALLQTLAPDDATRAAALQAFDASLPQPLAPDPRQQAFAQAQAAAVTAWQAQPSDQRDPQALAQTLAALRQTHFSDTPHPKEPR